jgi:hyaluronan synthase
MERVERDGWYFKEGENMSDATGQIFADKIRKRYIVTVCIVAYIAVLVVYKLFFIINPVFLLYSIWMGLFFGTTILLALFYDSVSLGQNFTPSVSIVIPTYNEKWMILKGTIMSSLKAEYRGKKEVIVVDDGSTNGTSKKLRNLRGIKLISFLGNRGNKFARAEGIKRAKGEIVIFMDSDTIIEKDAIPLIVAPFENKSMGAVSGHLKVRNAKSLLTKLQEGWYFTSFRVFRGAESAINCVTCCPGAFSAYRREFITPEIIDNWLYGRVIGLEVTSGVDRALTNLVLRNHDVFYQFSAKGRTEVPTTWVKFLKQQVRWTKSWIRETLFLLSIAYKKGKRSMFFYSSAILHFLNYGVIFFSLVIAPILHSPIYPLIYLASLAIAGFVYALFCRTQVTSWKLRTVFPIIYALITLPVLTYSLLTLRSKGWGTR